MEVVIDARLLGPKTVVFGDHPQWERHIRERLDPAVWSCRFGDLEAADLAEVDLVVPLRLNQYVTLERRGEAARGKALYPSRPAVRACHDKLEFARRLQGGPFEAMAPRLLDAPSARPPFILKRRKGAGGAYCHLVETQRDLDHLGDLIADPDYMLQEVIPGDCEYAMHLLVRNGRPVFHQGVVYQMDSTVYIKSQQFRHMSMTFTDASDHIDLFAKILATLDFENGSCCFNYKIVDGRVSIFEINPRVGASLVYRIGPYLKAYAAALAPD